MTPAKPSPRDHAGVMLRFLRAIGASNSDLWLYALAEARDCRSRAPVCWLIEAGIACPPKLRQQFADAVEAVGDYRRIRRRPPKFNAVDRQVVRVHWLRFCVEWHKRQPRKAPPVNRWIEIFREELRAVALRAGRPAPTDAELRTMAPASTLRRLIEDDAEGAT